MPCARPSATAWNFVLYDRISSFCCISVTRSRALFCCIKTDIFAIFRCQAYVLCDARRLWARLVSWIVLSLRQSVRRQRMSSLRLFSTLRGQLDVVFFRHRIQHPNYYSDCADASDWLKTCTWVIKNGKRSPYSITQRRVPELIPVLGSQPAGDVSHKPSGRLPLLSTRPAVTPATLKRAATSFAAW